MDEKKIKENIQHIKECLKNPEFCCDEMTEKFIEQLVEQKKEVIRFLKDELTEEEFKKAWKPIKSVMADLL